MASDPFTPQLVQQGYKNLFLSNPAKNFVPMPNQMNQGKTVLLDQDIQEKVKEERRCELSKRYGFIF